MSNLSVLHKDPRWSPWEPFGVSVCGRAVVQWGRLALGKASMLKEDRCGSVFRQRIS